MKIDTEYLVYTDAKGRDPDSHSPTLKAYNQILWSKKLPCGSIFELQTGKPNTYLYHKSKLVVGVENMPYKSFFKPILGQFLIDLGGTVSSRVTQKERTVFKHKTENLKVGPIICYESIYGSFVTEYIRRGADFLAIITNDAWWGNTAGHRQLLSYSRLRAIENRRSIVRSANTGISAIINRK